MSRILISKRYIFLRDDGAIAEPAVAEKANAGNFAIKDKKVADIEEDNDAINEIVVKIAAIREKRAAIRAEYRKDGEAFDEKVERVSGGNKGGTRYDCESCYFTTTNEIKARDYGLFNPWCVV